MIDHDQFRLASIADPYHQGYSARERGEFYAHCNACVACKQYYQRLLQFEKRLQRALRVNASQSKGSSASAPLQPVMVLRHESLNRPVPLNLDGFRGVIVPVEGSGSLAILARAESYSDNDFAETVAQVQGAFSFDRLAEGT